MAADVKQKLGAVATVTITLADGTDGLAAGAMRQATKIDNSSNLYFGAHLAGKIKTGVITEAGEIDVYVAGAIDGGAADYTGGCSGADAAFTGDNRNLIKLATVKVTKAATTYKFGPFNVAKAFGGRLPEFWLPVVHNRTNAALDTTAASHAIKYMGLYEQTT